MENIIQPLTGGAIIGLASTILLLFNGRILGITGIIEGIFSVNLKENLWRVLFLLGLLSGAFLMKFCFPFTFTYQFNATYLEMGISGLLVGFGTRLGGGCTSGHGVCGLPRLSGRSLVATLTFILAGALTVFLKGML